MPHIEINHDKEPIRLFKSDFLEFFTHITPTAVLIIWSPVVIFFITRAILNENLFANPVLIPTAILLGIVFWSFTEYILHRFLFHFRPKNAAQERIAFLFHGVHHAQPQCKTRLVMPPAVSIPMALIFYFLFWLIFNQWLNIGYWADPLFAGFMIGYLAYDLIHYATHHLPLHGKVLKFLKRHHMYHHMRTPDARFGVSSAFWDIVFKTLPADH